MSGELVLSLFPGIGLLDMAFEDEGYCIVRGPDALWGGDIRRFHPPGGVFAGLIGGPPCQPFSRMANIARHRGYTIAPDLIPEFERCVAESRPRWFLMENVPTAPLPRVSGYLVTFLTLNNRWLGEEQNRTRRFALGSESGRFLVIDDVALFESPRFEPAVMAGSGKAINVKLGGSGKVKATWRVERHPRGFPESLRLQGLPDDFLADAPFTQEGKRAVGNGVPLPMGRAIARAVKRAMSPAEASA